MFDKKNVNVIISKSFKLNYQYIKIDKVIWAKLTQGNGRGTCFWIKHNVSNL